MTNFFRDLLFSQSMSFLDLLILIWVNQKFGMWQAVGIYLLWCWIISPIVARAVGASPADLARIKANKGKAHSSNEDDLDL